MNHKWKIESLKDVVKYNGYLLTAVVLLSVVCLLLSFALIDKEEKWVAIPMNDIDNKMEVSNTKLYPSYLKSWAVYIAKELFTTSPEEIEKQHAEIQKISASSKELKSFFTKQLAFVQGNRASSVFYVKSTKLVQGGVLVTGTFNYWFAGSEHKVALEKSYLLSYRQAARGLILLDNVEEVDIEKIKAIEKINKS